MPATAADERRECLMPCSARPAGTYRGRIDARYRRLSRYFRIDFAEPTYDSI